jgi:uncharacterized protein (UPF0335 family)
MTAMTMRTVRGRDGSICHVPTAFVVKPGKKAPRAPDPIKTNGDSAAEELRLLIERGERIDQEIAEMQGDRRDFYAEVKSRGYDPKALRAIMTLRRKDRDVVAEEEAILDLYRQHLGML